MTAALVAGWPGARAAVDPRAGAGEGRGGGDRHRDGVGCRDPVRPGGERGPAVHPVVVAGGTVVVGGRPRRPVPGRVVVRRRAHRPVVPARVATRGGARRVVVSGPVGTHRFAVPVPGRVGVERPDRRRGRRVLHDRRGRVPGRDVPRAVRPRERVRPAQHGGGQQRQQHHGAAGVEPGSACSEPAGGVAHSRRTVPAATGPPGLVTGREHSGVGTRSAPPDRPVAIPGRPGEDPARPAGRATVNLGHRFAVPAVTRHEHRSRGTTVQPLAIVTALSPAATADPSVGPCCRDCGLGPPGSGRRRERWVVTTSTRQQRTSRVSDCTLGVVAAVTSGGIIPAWVDGGPTVQSFPIARGVVLGFLIAATVTLLVAVVVRWMIHRVPRVLVLATVAAIALSVAGMLTGVAVTIAAATPVLLVATLLMTGFGGAFLAALLAVGGSRPDRTPGTA